MRPSAEPDSDPAWLALPTVLLERAALIGAQRKDSSRLAALYEVDDPDAERRIAELVDAFEPSVTQAQARFDLTVIEGEDGFAVVARCAGLDGVDARVLALVAAIECDERCRELAVLTGGLPGVRATPALVERLLGRPALAALAPDAPLVRAALLSLDAGAAFGTAEIVLARQAVWRLLDIEGVDPALPVGARLTAIPAELGHGVTDVVVVHGADPTRRLQAAMYATRGTGFLITEEASDDAAWRAVVRQATLDGLGVVLTLDGPLSAHARYWIDRCPHLCWAVCSRDPQPMDALPDRPHVQLEAAAPPVGDEEWANVFPDWPLPSRRPDADQLRLARAAARPGESPVEVLTRVARGALLRHARRVRPTVGWDDVILPPGAQAQIRGLVDRYRHRGRVHDEWGLPLYPSPGVVALFSGPSGTGKTTTAEVIAGELGVDLFRVDLSALVSKYIGETEKHLEEIFSAAHSGGYLLLFDEADSLFGARSKVTDARDRYANMEISYLLQRLETYDGFVVLTSNFQGNIDAAFLRRIHVNVHFALPSVADRLRIWRLSLGAAPTDTLDLDFVAEKFDLSGGSIRNAALSAAFLAAAQDSPVTMIHLLRAVTQELTKLGRRPTDDQYGRWRAEVFALDSPDSDGG